ncbi:Rhomboid-like protein 11 [Nymphaea thermarum]|nr:Rhomboid-like protein 11 [Nymphaea thermarum]
MGSRMIASPSFAFVSGGGAAGGGGGLSITTVPAIPQRLPMVADGVRSPSGSRFLRFPRNSCVRRLLFLHEHPRSLSRRFICGMSNSDMISQLELGKPDEKPGRGSRVNGVFWILLLNLGIYVVDHWFQVNTMKSLYLNHAWPQWYQFITATFCHADWNHLSSNLFFLYIFGKLVEEDEGSFALWISYLLTGAGANLVSWLVLPRNAVSIGASGAVFGLFAISVLVKMRWDWRKILEVLILGQFVLKKVMEEAQASARLPGTIFGGYSLHNINHIAHLSGALIGVLLIWLLSGIPSRPTQDTQGLRRRADST